MSEPDEAMVGAVAAAMFNRWYPLSQWAENPTWPIVEQYRDQARAVLSVPVVRDALARDAQVAEIVKRVQQPDDEWGRPVSYVYADGMDDVIAIHAPSPGDRDDSEEQR